MVNHELQKLLFKEDRSNFFLLAGPCVVESEELVFEVARQIKEIAMKLDTFIIVLHNIVQLEFSWTILNYYCLFQTDHGM